MSSTKKSYLGTENERIKSYYEDRQASIRITMLEARLSELHSRGIIESPEIDRILEDIAILQQDLRYGWGLE